MEGTYTKSAMFYRELGHTDRLYDSGMLFEFLAALRGRLGSTGPISPNTRARCRRLAGLGRDRRHKLTQREAMAVAVVALYNDAIRPSIGSNVKASQLKALQIPAVYDQWVASGDAVAREVLDFLAVSQLPTVAQLGAMANQIKSVPPSTLRRWLRLAGMPSCRQCQAVQVPAVMAVLARLSPT